MVVQQVKIEKVKRIALVAHDLRKDVLIEWAKFNKITLSKHKLYATGTTGKLLKEKVGLEVES